MFDVFAIFVLVPALPILIAVSCLKARRRWIPLRVFRWALLISSAATLLLAWYGVEFDKSFRLSAWVLAAVWPAVAEAYVIAVLVSFLQPWREPKANHPDASVT